MLPTTASYVQRKGHYRRLQGGAASSALQWRSYLLMRSRATNLAVGIGAVVCALSLLLNLQLWFSSGTPNTYGFPTRASNGQTAYNFAPLSILSTLNGRLRGLDHLIVVSTRSKIIRNISLTSHVQVAGHAIWHGCSPNDRLHEDDWVLEPIQREQQLLGTFFKHISKG